MSTFTLTGTITSVGTGDRVPARVLIEPVTSPIVGADGETLYVGPTMVITDEQGDFEAELLDSVGTTPSVIVYRLRVEYAWARQGRSFPIVDFNAPGTGGTIDLSDLIGFPVMEPVPPDAITEPRMNELLRTRSVKDPTRKLIGPVAISPDSPTIVTNASADPSYNRAYIVTGSTWERWDNSVLVNSPEIPVDVGEGPEAFSGNYSRSVPLSAVRRWAFILDGTKVAFQTENVSGNGGDSFLVFVNGAPVSLSLQAWPASAQLTTMVFPDARPRLIEVYTTAGLHALFCALPYKIRKPPIGEGPKMLVVGDSYAMGATIDTSSPTATAAPRMNGWAQRLGLRCGIERFITDGVGGTGFIRRNSPATDNLNDRVMDHIALDPDVLAVVSGGSNDLFTGSTVPDIITAARNYLVNARLGLPNAKLIFFEGFAPPNGFSTFNDEYADISAGLRADGAVIGAGVYFVDVATTMPWISGTGWKGATASDGNADVYVGGDGIHLTTEGNRAVEGWAGPIVRKILADDGELLNTLVS